MKILAIDDEPLFCELLSAALRDIGHDDARILTSAEAALIVLASEHAQFDCFLVDIHMRPMDGIELVRRIRNIDRFRHTPIIMITALVEKSSIDAAFLAGANDYITKPLKPVELKARLSMAQEIVEARTQTQVLNQQVLAAEDQRAISLTFDRPFLLDEPDCLTSIMSLENYVLKLGNLRLKPQCAIGFRVVNARELFNEYDGLDYSDIMADTATVISSALSRTPHLLAYAGYGVFVAIAPRRGEMEWQSVQLDIEDILFRMKPAYDGSGLRLPKVVSGTPATVNLLSFDQPTKIISKAISSAKSATLPAENETDDVWL